MRSNYKTEEKENFIDSDPHTPTMASCIFDNILQEIQVSNLNYQIQLSPFSALISLKKSFIKEKDGSLRLPMPPLSSSHRGSRLETDLNARNMKLEKDLETLHQKYADVSDQYAEAHARIKSYEEFHENHFKREFAKKDDIIADLKLEKNSLIEKVKERDDTIKELQNSINVKIEVTKNLNRQLTESKARAGREKAAIAKEFKAEIKSWRTDLGEERKQKIRLEKKIVELSKNPKPVDKDEVFRDKEYSPASLNFEQASNECKHHPQCIVRQPLPPPSPAMPFLQNQDSKYHEHMMSNAGVPGKYGGCERCMREYYSKNYGCDDCIWLKWHGELHGYPDINPWVFKKHLESSELQVWGLR